MAVPPTNVLPIPIKRSGGDANVDIAGRQHRTPGPVGADALSAPLRNERKSRLHDEGKQQTTIRDGSNRGSNEFKRVHRPVYGQQEYQGIKKRPFRGVVRMMPFQDLGKIFCP